MRRGAAPAVELKLAGVGMSARAQPRGSIGCLATPNRQPAQSEWAERRYDGTFFACSNVSRARGALGSKLGAGREDPNSGLESVLPLVFDGCEEWHGASENPRAAGSSYELT